MAFEDDPYHDEDGEPLMDFDQIQSDEEQQQQQHEQFPQDDLNDDVPDFEDEDEDINWNQQQQQQEERSPTPENSKGKTRKRLVKKSDAGSSVSPEFNDFSNDDEGVDGYDSTPGDGSNKGKNKGLLVKEGGERKRKEKKFRKEKLSGSGGGGSKPKLSLKRRKGSGGGGDARDPEVQEMWDTIAGADSEDDKDGTRTMDDDNFIDDTDADPAHRYASDREGSPSRFAQAEEGEEDDEMKQLFRPGKKKKKTERSAGEIALMVEQLMAEFEVVAEEDAHLNDMGKPAINKLKKLPVLIDALSKKQIQHEFLDHGVLTLLKNWLEPLPDGSLPNINIREAILKILTDFPIDLDQFDRREQLKKSGLGKVIMFLSRTDEETTSNRKLAKDLVDKWSRPIFNKSTRFEDMRNVDEERVYRRPSVKKPTNRSSGLGSKDDDLDLSRHRSEVKSGQSSTRQLTIRPEATPMDFHIRPQSKIDPDEIRARAKQVQHDERRMKMNKKLQQLKAMKKKKLQATKVSVEGRGMVKYM